MRRCDLVFISLVLSLPALKASAQDCTTTGIESAVFDPSARSLMVVFGDSNGRARFSYDSESRLILVQSSNCYTAGRPLIVNGKETVSIDDVSDVTILGGSGNDVIITNTLYNLGGQSGWVLRIFGGDGDDYLQGPEDILGSGATYLYGGNGNDTLYSEHGNNNSMLGEAGNDVLSAGAIPGGTQHYNYLDGGSGNNTYFSFSSNDTFMIRQGSSGYVLDLGGDDTYVFLGDGSSSSGFLYIFELPNSGFDTLDFSQWSFPVSVDLALTEPQIVSVDEGGTAVLTLQLTYPNTIENIIYPGK